MKARLWLPCHSSAGARQCQRRPPLCSFAQALPKIRNFERTALEDFTACPSALASRVSFVCPPALAVQESRVSTDTSSCWRVNKDSAEGTSVPQVALDRCFERTCTEPRALSAPLKETMSLPLSDWLNDQNESTRVQNGVLITPRIPTSFSSTI